jgi:hypothetical protein
MVAPIPVGLCLCTVLVLVERDNSSEDIAYVLYWYWMREMDLKTWHWYLLRKMVAPRTLPLYCAGTACSEGFAFVPVMYGYWYLVERCGYSYSIVYRYRYWYGLREMVPVSPKTIPLCCTGTS